MAEGDQGPVRRYQPGNGHRRPTPLVITDGTELATNWKRFYRGYTSYSEASYLDYETKRYQCSVFMTLIGDDALERFEGFKFEQGEDEKDIDVVIAKFQEFCVGATHEAFESYRFHVRTQSQAETIDTYVAELRKLARGCNFGDQEDRMIRDRILVGCKSDHVREKLLEDSELTLRKALDICRSLEASQTKLQLMSNSSNTKEVDRVEKRSHNRQPKGGQKQERASNSNSEGNGYKKDECRRCGKPWHDNVNDCRARKARCRKCHLIGHYEHKCGTTNIRKNIRRLEDEDEEAILGSIKEVNSVDVWNAELLVDQKKMEFRIDTGADVTVVPDRCFKSLDRLKKTDKQLYGPGGSRIEVLGVFTATLETKNTKSVQDLYVIKGLKKPLLGKPAIQALNILQRINAVETEPGTVDPKKDFPELWNSLGRVHNSYTIRLKADAKPFSISTPRRLPLPMKDKVEEELKSLKEKEIIRQVTTPTDWCAPIVAVPKASGKIRLCVDYTKLNESVRRENFPLPTTDELLAQLDGATVFSKLDCNQGFHQIPLSEESQELTTFITPFGRFCYQRLPFGISSGPEIFHREMTHTLAGIPGVICDIDDILIGGKGQTEHDERLRMVLQRLKEAGLTLNDKCEFSKGEVKFLGHIVSAQGIAIDPSKVEAIASFPAPEGVPELRRLLGMVNHVAKFAPNLAEVTKPLRDLLKKENDWVWGPDQEEAFKKLKTLLSTAPVLQHYNPNKPTLISADASSYGMGGVLMQKDSEGWKPVFYASRSMTSTEQRYAQVEKEALAMTWTCEKFADFLVGMSEFTIETDHKPLLALMKTKLLDELTPRIQRFRMRMMRFTYNVVYTAGKNLATADALSRAHSQRPGKEEERKEHETGLYVRSIVDGLPATDQRLEEVRREQQKDVDCKKIVDYVLRDHWPDSAKRELGSYYYERHAFSVVDRLLLHAGRLVIPSAMRKDMLDRIHQGHQGVVKCRALARSCVWWPGLSKDIATLVEQCAACEKYRRDHPQPLIPTPTPEFAWQRLASDLFEWQGLNYLLIVDYYSRWIEISHLTSLSSTAVINSCKAIFSRQGIPEVLMSDNGTQYTSREFSDFAEYYGFTHITSSPYHPSGNGEAERAVQTVKNLLRKEKDPFLALLNYRTTPLPCGYSPAELLMNRRLRTRIPAVRPTERTREQAEFRTRDKEIKERQKRDFDRRHRVKELPPLKEGQEVWIKTPKSTTEAVVTKTSTARSVPVETGQHTSRRNRAQIRYRSSTTINPPSIPKESDILPSRHVQEPEQETTEAEEPPGEAPPVDTPAQTQTTVTTRSGRVVKPPRVLDL